MYKDIHHPITNGKTKVMILISLVFLCLTTLVGMVMLFELPSMYSGISLWVVKGNLGTITIASVFGVVYSVRSFFDNREAKQKHEDRLARLQEKNRYKLEKYKIKKGGL